MLINKQHFWSIDSTQLNYFRQNGLCLLFESNNKLARSLYCFYFHNIDKSLFGFEQKDTYMQETVVHSKILIGPGIFLQSNYLYFKYNVLLYIYFVLFKTRSLSNSTDNNRACSSSFDVGQKPVPARPVFSNIDPQRFDELKCICWM